MVYNLASIYEGTPISEFEGMPIPKLMKAAEHAERIGKERERAAKRAR